MKKILFCLCSFLFILSLLSLMTSNVNNIELPVANIFEDETYKDTRIENKTLYILSPYISYGVNSFYGKERYIDFNGVKVIDFKSLAENNESYEVTLQIFTATPNLKGPYGIERITLLNELGTVKITNFIHVATTQKNPIKNKNSKVSL